MNLISTLVHRALIICNKRRLNEEIEWIKIVLLDNDYPKNVVNVQNPRKSLSSPPLSNLALKSTRVLKNPLDR